MRNPAGYHRPIVLALVGLATVPLAAAELKPETRAAFEQYVRLTEAAHDRDTVFLLIDARPEKERARLYQQLRGGEIVVWRQETKDAGRRIPVEHGLIHHWVGTVLHRGVTLERAEPTMKDYDRYAERTPGTVERSSLLSRSGDRFDVALRLRVKKIITVVLNTRHTIEYTAVDARHIAVRTESTRIAEVRNPGKPSESEAPPEGGHGFLWRVNVYCSFEERPEGMYEQCESISLTRDVPRGLGWIIRPLISSFPRDIMVQTLAETRAYFEAHAAPGAGAPTPSTTTGRPAAGPS